MRSSKSSHTSYLDINHAFETFKGNSTCSILTRVTTSRPATSTAILPATGSIHLYDHRNGIDFRQSVPKPVLSGVLLREAGSNVIRTGRRCASSSRVNPVDRRDLVGVRRIQRERSHRRHLDVQLEPRHSCATVLARRSTSWRRDRVGFLGEIDAVVGVIGVEIEGCGGEVGEVVVAGLEHSGDWEVATLFGGEVGELVGVAGADDACEAGRVVKGR